MMKNIKVKISKENNIILQKLFDIIGLSFKVSVSDYGYYYLEIEFNNNELYDESEYIQIRIYKKSYFKSFKSKELATNSVIKKTTFKDILNDFKYSI